MSDVDGEHGRVPTDKPTRVNAVVLPLTTTLTITSFPTLAPNRLDLFIPSYKPLSDGSLPTTRYLQQVHNSNVSLLIGGALFVVFLRNFILSTSYLFRTRSKDRTLFYFLLSSQTIGPIAIAILALSFLLDSIPCAPVVVIFVLGSGISQSILVAGILGLKVYRYLEKPKIVLWGLIFSSAGVFSLILIYLSEMTTVRSTAGQCGVKLDTMAPVLPVAYLVISMQAVFVCIAFGYAVRKAAKSPAAQCRISIVSSNAPDPCDAGDLSFPEFMREINLPEWWQSEQKPESILRNSNAADSQQQTIEFAPARPIRLPERTRGYSEPSIAKDSAVGNVNCPLGRCRPRTAQWRRRPNFTRFFRAAMKDELFYTACVALNSFTFSTIIIIRCIQGHDFWSMPLYPAIDWTISSLIVMHKFTRVVRRDELETALEHSRGRSSTYVAHMGRTTGTREPESQPISFVLGQDRPGEKVANVTSTDGNQKHASSSTEFSNPFETWQEVSRRAGTPQRVLSWQSLSSVESQGSGSYYEDGESTKHMLR